MLKPCKSKYNINLKQGRIIIDKEYTYEIIKTFVRVYEPYNQDRAKYSWYKQKYFNFTKKDFKENFTSVNMERKEKLKNISFLYEKI